MSTNPNPPHSETTQQQLSALLDGELSPQAAECLRARLAADDDLSREFDELNALDELLEQWPAPPAADVRQAVMARVQRDLGKSARPARAWRWASLAWAATWMLGGALTGLTLWSTVDHQIDEQIAVETISQDMTLSMIMTEDWTAPIAIEEVAQP